MPKTDDRFMGKPYRYGYLICRPPGALAGSIGLSAIGRYDHETGQLKAWEPGPDCGVQEPTFIPRRNGSKEGDGYLIALVNRMAENRSDLVILDAQALGEAPPIATLRLPVRVRSTFHGVWAPKRVLETGRYGA
jgi:carotenoid cleavage dioxygenase